MADRPREDSLKPLQWARVALLTIIATRSFMPEALRYLFGGRLSETSTDRVTIQVSSAAHAAQLLDLTLLVVSGYVVLTAFRLGSRGGRRNGLLLLYLTVFLAGVLSMVVLDGSIRLSLLAVGVALVALVVVPPSPVEAVAVGAVATTLVATISLALGPLLPETALIASGDERFYIWGGQRLAGVMSHPNALGYVLTIGLPLVMAWFRDRTRFLAVLVIVAAVTATGSRTSLVGLAVIAGFVAVAARGPDLAERGPKLTIARVLPLSFVLVASLCVSLLPWVGYRPVLMASPGRFILWDFVTAYWDSHPVFGHGPGAWADLATQSSTFYTFAFHAHNLWLDVLFTTGLVGASALALMVIVWVLRSMRMLRLSYLPTLLATVFLLNATTEVPLYYLNWDARGAMLVLALSASARQVRQLTPHPQPAARATASGPHGRRRVPRPTPTPGRRHQRSAPVQD